MKQYKLVLSPDTEINVDFSAARAVWRKLYNAFWKQSFWFGLMLVAVSVTGSLVYAATEVRVGSYIMYLLLSLGVAGGLLLMYQILQGRWMSMADPQGFLGVLVFALITIVVWIIAPQIVQIDTASYRYLNTFGIMLTKPISGLGLIGFIALFYLVNQFINTEYKLKASAIILLVGGIAAALLGLFYPEIKNLEVFASLAAAAGLSFFAVALYVPLPRLPAFALSAIAFAAAMLSSTPDKWRIALAAFLACLIWAWFEYWINRNKKNTLLIASVGILSFVLAIILIFGAPTTVQSSIKAIVDFPLQVVRDRDAAAILLGAPEFFAGDFQAFWHLVLSYQGLLGLAAYGVLAATSLVLSVRALKNRHWAKALVPGFIMLFALSFVANIGMVVILWMWLLFSLFVAAQKIKEREESTGIGVQPRIWRWKLPKWWQLSALVIIPLFVYIWFLVNSQLLLLLANAQI